MNTPWRTAFITGASGGLGKGLALWLANRGVKVWIAARRGTELEAVRAEARQGSVMPLILDVSNAAATLRAIQKVDDECGGLDLVIANAAWGTETPGHALNWDDVARTIDVNVTGAAATLTAIADRMAKRRKGHLVALSSLAGMRGLPNTAAYSASKAWLTAFTEALRVDLVPRGVTVTTIHPGFIRTPGTARNKFPMPFLLEADDAVNRMGHALLRGAADVRFPWPISFAMRLLQWMPNWLYDRVVRRGSPYPPQ